MNENIENTLNQKRKKIMVSNLFFLIYSAVLIIQNVLIFFTR